MSKLDYSLIPVEFDDLVLVAMNGAKKYEPHGWEKGIDKEQNLASIKRHINDFREGELEDNESKLHPLLHAAFRCMMQYTLDMRQNKKYDEKGEEGWTYRKIRQADVNSKFHWKLASEQAIQFKNINGYQVYQPFHWPNCQLKNCSNCLNDFFL